MPTQLKSRVLGGTLLIAAFLAILYGDRQLDPRQRFLPTCLLVLAILAGLEIRSLLPRGQPRILLLLPVLALLILLHWSWLDQQSHAGQSFQPYGSFKPHEKPPYGFGSFMLPLLGFGLVTAMLVELLLYSADGQGTSRVANTLFLWCYLGIPAQMLINLQHLPDKPAPWAIAATILVPKFGDVAAYLSGSMVGRHRMTPTLSPKKTWEGLTGGLAASVITAILINYFCPVPLFPRGWPEASAFGIFIGLAGVAGDLFASMIKRDAQAKDASQLIPGFGGVLDVIDSVLLAAPAAWLFFIF